MSRLEKAPTRRGCEPVRPFAGISLQRVQSLLRAAIEMVEPDRLRQKLGKGRGPRPILLGNSGLVFLELDVESELHHSRAGWSAGHLSERRAGDGRVSQRKRRVVRRIQHFTLKHQLVAFVNRNALVDRQVDVVPAWAPKDRAITPDSTHIAGRSWITVGRKHGLVGGSRLQLELARRAWRRCSRKVNVLAGIERVYPGISVPIHAYAALQLRGRRAVHEGNTGVAAGGIAGVVVDRRNTASQVRRRTGLDPDNRSDAPSADHMVGHAALIEEMASLAERQIVGSTGVHHMTDVEEAGSVVEAEIAVAVVDIVAHSLNAIL